MLGMCGLRCQRLTFLAKEQDPARSAPPAQSPWGSVFSSVKWAEYLHPKTETRAHVGVRRPQQENLSPPPHPCPLPPLHHGREEGGQVGPLALEFPGTISLTLGRNHPPHTTKSTILPAQEPRGLAVGLTQDWAVEDGTPLGLAGTGQAHTRAVHVLQGWGDMVPLGLWRGLREDGEASGGLRTREQVGGAGGGSKGGQENEQELQAAPSRCSVNACWLTEYPRVGQEGAETPGTWIPLSRGACAPGPIAPVPSLPKRLGLPQARCPVRGSPPPACVSQRVATASRAQGFHQQPLCPCRGGQAAQGKAKALNSCPHPRGGPGGGRGASSSLAAAGGVPARRPIWELGSREGPRGLPANASAARPPPLGWRGLPGRLGLRAPVSQAVLQQQAK